MKQISNKKGFTGPRGFSLIDVLVALALISVTMLVLGLVYPGLRLSQGSRNLVVANSIAEKKLEELKNISFDDLVEVSDTSFADDELNRLINASAKYSVELFDVDGDASVEEDIKLITVTVTFDDSGGTKTRTLTSTTSRYGFAP